MAFPGQDSDRLLGLLQDEQVAKATDLEFSYPGYSIYVQAADLFNDGAPRGSSLPSSG